MDGGDGGAKMRVGLMPLNVHLKMVKEVHIMSCVFYHNILK